MLVTLNNEEWELAQVNRLGPRFYPCLGDCCIETRKIRIVRGQSAQDELDTLIHEMLHACGSFADEEWVTRTATEIATVLFEKFGYRKQTRNGKLADE